MCHVLLITWCSYIHKLNAVCICLQLTTDLAKVKAEQEEKDEGDGPVVPLLMQNKPPVDCSSDKLTDVEVRPDQVGVASQVAP